MNLTAKILLQFAVKTADEALGIPDRKRFGDVSQIPKDQLIKWIVQQHDARRAGKHFDVRLGTPQTGLYSWATRKELPEPGGKTMLFQQPVHCFPPSTLVLTECGPIPIHRLVDRKMKVRVASTDCNGVLIYKNVLNYWRRRADEPIVSIGVSVPFRKLAHIRCTRGHELFSCGVKVQAGNIVVGDCLDVLLPTPNADQMQILWGGFLGDSSVAEKGEYRFGHSSKHEDYFRWKMAALTPFFRESVERFGHGRFSSHSFLTACGSQSHPWFAPLRHLYASGKKEIDSSFLSRLGPLALAVWYQDDGSRLCSGKQFSGCAFATHGFSAESVLLLRNWLAERFNIQSFAVSRNKKKQFEIRLNTTNAKRLFSIIAPFVHPSMAYKLLIPEKYNTKLCKGCGQVIDASFLVCDACLLSEVRGFSCLAQYVKSYYRGETLVSPKTIELRCGSWKAAKGGLLVKSAKRADPLIFVCGTALLYLNREPVFQSWPVKVAYTSVSSPRKNERYLYDLEVEDTHKYIVRNGFVVSNSYEYSSFQGRIPSGYGAGTVRTHDMGTIGVQEASNDKIKFFTAHKGTPEFYTMIRTTGPRKGAGRTERTQGGSWLLINTTPVKAPQFLGTDEAGMAKLKYKSVPAADVEKLFTQGNIIQNKVDGASMLYKLFGDHIEAVSYRIGKSGHPIIHTQRMFGLGGLKAKIPPELVGSILRGEAYGTREGKAIPPQELGGLLNAGVAKSLEAQKQKGVQLRTMLFDVAGEQDKPYAERLAKLQKVITFLPKEKFHLPESATDPAAMKSLWEQISTGKHSLTSEGVVSWPEKGLPTKVKVLPESDVWVKGIFPGEKGLTGVGAGGFEYGTSPEGPVVGRVGTGFSEEARKQMLADPEGWVGRMARIRSMGQFPGGAHRAPAFLALHEDYPSKMASLVSIIRKRRGLRCS